MSEVSLRFLRSLLLAENVSMTTNVLFPHNSDSPSGSVGLEQGYDSKELAAAFMAFFRAIFGGEPNSELDIADSKFLLKCCVSAGFSLAEAEQYVRSSEDANIKSRLKVFMHNLMHNAFLNVLVSLVSLSIFLGMRLSQAVHAIS